MMEIEQQKMSSYIEDTRSNEIRQLFEIFETRLSLSKTSSKILIISLSSVLQDTSRRSEFDIDGFKS